MIIMKSMRQLDPGDLNEALHNMGYFDGEDVVLTAEFRAFNKDGHAVYDTWMEDGLNTGRVEKCRLFVWKREGKLVAEF